MKTFFFTLRASIESEVVDANEALNLLVGDLQSSLDKGEAIPITVHEMNEDGMSGEPYLVHFQTQDVNDADDTSDTQEPQ